MAEEDRAKAVEVAVEVMGEEAEVVAEEDGAKAEVAVAETGAEEVASPGPFDLGMT